MPTETTLDVVTAPSFIVVNGNVHYFMNGSWSILEPGTSLRYRKHGWYKIAFVRDDHGIIDHMQMATGGTKRPIFIPPKKRVTISKGQFLIAEVRYESFQKAFAPS